MPSPVSLRSSSRSWAAVVVENRGGAGGALGAREVAGAAPDGYTLLVGDTSSSPSSPPHRECGLRSEQRFCAGCPLESRLLVVHPSQPWMSLKELVDEAKANPGKLAYARTGGGDPISFRRAVHGACRNRSGPGPYRSGGELATAVLTQAVQLTIGDVGVMLPLVQEGKLRRSP